MSDYETAYNERLMYLDLLPLTYCREYLDLVFIYNSLNDLNLFDMSCFNENRHFGNDDELK